MQRKPKFIKDEEFPEMWRILWPNGDLSDMYNLHRAKEHLRVYYEKLALAAETPPSITSTMPPRALEKAVGAFK